MICIFCQRSDLYHFLLVRVDPNLLQQRLELQELPPPSLRCLTTAMELNLNPGRSILSTPLIVSNNCNILVH